MTRHYAFLRAINVGGHTVKMTDLIPVFEALGFSNVTTFIASGNVVFEAESAASRELESRIEGALESRFGYAVGVFVRSARELRAIEELEPFPDYDPAADGSLQVIFLHEAPDAELRARVEKLDGEVDSFHVSGREIYWLCHTRMSESPVFRKNLLDKATRRPGTARNMNTVRRLLQKYEPAATSG